MCQIFLCFHCNFEHKTDERSRFKVESDIDRGLYYDRGEYVSHICGRARVFIRGIFRNNMESRCEHGFPFEHQQSVDPSTFEIRKQPMNRCGIVFPIKSRPFAKDSREHGYEPWSRRYKFNKPLEQIDLETSILHTYASFVEFKDRDIPSNLISIVESELQSAAAGYSTQEDIDHISDGDSANVENADIESKMSTSDDEDSDLENNAAFNQPRNVHQDEDSETEEDIDLDLLTPVFQPESVHQLRDSDIETVDSQDSEDEDELERGEVSGTVLSDHPSDNEVVHEMTKGCPNRTDSASTVAVSPTPAVYNAQEEPLQRQMSSQSNMSLSQRMEQRRRNDQVPRGFKLGQQRTIVLRRCFQFVQINNLDILDSANWSTLHVDHFNKLCTDCGFYWVEVIRKMQKWQHSRKFNVNSLIAEDTELENEPLQNETVTAQSAVKSWLNSTGPAIYSKALQKLDFNLVRRHFTQ